MSISDVLDRELVLLELDEDLTLSCEMVLCENPAIWRIWVAHNMVDVPAHAAGQMVICDACYRRLNDLPHALAVCPQHRYVVRIRDWWTLIGKV